MTLSRTLQFVVSLEKLKTQMAGGETPETLLAFAQELETEAAALSVPEFVSAARQQRAAVLARLGRDDEAIALLAETRRNLRGLREQDHGPDLIRKQAELHAARGRWEEVDALIEEGIRLVESFRAKVSAQYLASAFLKPFIGLYTLGVRAAYLRGDTARMLARAELSKCRSLVGRASRRPVSSAELAGAERQFAEICAQVNATSAPGDGLLDRRRALWDVLEVQRQRARGATIATEFSLAAVQRALAEDEAMLYHYWLEGPTLLSIAISRTDCRANLQTLDETVHRKLHRYAKEVLAFVPDRNATYGWFADVQNFAGELLPEPLHPVLAGAKRLVISPHRMLHAIPYHALTWKGAPLIATFAVRYVPNLSSLLVPPAAPAAVRRVLSVGVRDYAVAEAKLVPLPGVHAELDAIRAAWSATGTEVVELRDEGATEHALDLLAAPDGLGGFSHLHFAVHGRNVESDTPMESHLFLRDSRLDGLEISRWRLSAELVVLGACCSGQRPVAGRGLDELPGDEMFGLAAAFFAAGARCILCTHWPANDEVSARVNAAVHRGSAAGTAPELALQRAMHAELASGSQVYKWAPYFLSTFGPSTSSTHHDHHQPAV